MPTLVETIRDFFTNCTTVPEEHFEYYNYLPLYQPFEDVGMLDSDSESGHEYVEDDMELEQEEESEYGGVQVPEVSELEKRFKEESGGAERLDSTKTVKLVRDVGYAPSKADEKNMRAKYKSGLNFEEAQEWMRDIKHEEDSQSYLRSMFKYYDVENTGKLKRDTVKTILTSHGGEEALSEDEYETLLKKQGQSGEDVEYEKLIDALLKRRELFS